MVFAAGTAAGVCGGAAGACGVAAGAGVGVGSAVVDCRTEREPVTPGRDSSSAVSMKRPAAVIVILARIVCVPRGPKAVLETELVKSAPASAYCGVPPLPGAGAAGG
ncbi:MAG TPA: hypothetical protein VHC97_24795, partial [Thermoanaerobaculia bacterium]|nr:hypothetical protein [Thermoanaerobaculia bacterium]